MGKQTNKTEKNKSKNKKNIYANRIFIMKDCFPAKIKNKGTWDII